MLGEEHNNAFTVAKMMDADLLKTVQVKLQDALDNGGTFDEFKKQLIPELQAAGWWGKKDIVDPLTGKIVKAQLGSASRLETIFRSNLQSAYSVGQWDNIQASARTAPYLMYDAVDDYRTRPEHAARDGEVHPVNSTFWQSHFPPNGWNCRCGVIQLDEDDVKEMGLQVTKSPDIQTTKWKNPRTGILHDIPIDTDPGWDINPGIHRQKQIAEAADQKAQAMLNAQQQAAMQKALEKQKIKQIEYEKKIAQDKELKALQKKQDAASDLISEALTANTPYLASEIKKLQKAKPDGDSISILEAAQAKALKSEQNSMVQTWKQAKKKGKEPSAKAQAYVNSLPQEVQDALNNEIKAVEAVKKEAAKQKEVMKEIADILAVPDPDPYTKAAQMAYLDNGATLGSDLESLLAAMKKEGADALLAIEKAATAELATIAAGEAVVQKGLKQKILSKWKKEGIAAGYFTDTDLLDAVIKESSKQQKKAEQSSVMSGYKKKVLAGQIPTPKQQKVFNSISQADKNKVLADIDKKKIKAGITVKPEPEVVAAKPQAPVTPVEYNAITDPNIQYKVLYHASGIGNILQDDFPEPHKAKKISKAQLDDLIGELEEHIYDNGEEVGEIAQLFINEAAQDGQLWALAKSAKPKPAAAPLGDQINLDSLIKIGGQGGSNAGGMYQDTKTGTKWYIKHPDSEDFTRNEVLTGKLYKLAGIDTPDTQIINFEGKLSIASKIIDDLKTNKAGLTADKVAGVKDNFVFDAWLANWDVVGLDYDNLMVKNGKAYRIDTGAGLLYRAQGGKKGDKFGNKVVEIDTLRDAKMNPQAAAVFKNVTQADIEAGVARLAKISDDDIKALVDSFGPKTKAQATALYKKLIARKADLIKRFHKADPKIKALKKAAAIEAQAELLSETVDVDFRIVTALKGINSQAGDKAMLRDKDIARVKDARAGYKAMLANYGSQMTKGTKDALDSHYGAILDELEDITKGGAGTPAKSNSGGMYDGWKSSGQPLKIDPERVDVYIPKDGDLPKFTDAQIKAEMSKAFGSSAYQKPPLGNAHLKALSEAERGAINIYTGGFYRKFNDALRESKGDAPKYNKARDIINAALAKGKPFVGSCARGISFSAAEFKAFMGPIKEAYNSGKAWTDHGYMSSSRGDKAAFGGNVILMMDGKTGVDVVSISRHPGEREVLFSAGTKWFVTDITEQGGKTIINITESE